MTDNRLRLFCLVDGESASNVFPVKLSRNHSIGDLKKLIKTEKSPEFDDIPADKLTLWRVFISVPVNKHKPIVLNEFESATELNPMDDVSDVFAEQPPKKEIHIIVHRPPQGLILEFDFLQHVPGAIIGRQQDRGPSMSSSHRVYSLSPSPRSWDILDSVLSMELDPTPKHKRPQFMEDRKYAPESMLHELFKHDFGSVKVLPPFAETTHIMRLRHGVPDLVCLRENSDCDLPESVLFPVEIKRPAVLRSGNLVEDYEAQERSDTSAGPGDALRQAFGYMRLNGYRYGILSTYEQTWFLKRGDQDADHDLMVSPTIAFNRSEPTLLQCYLWFIRQADSDTRPLDPPTDTEVRKMLKGEQRRNDKRRKISKSDKEKKPIKDSVSSLFGSRKTQANPKETTRVILPAFDSMKLISHDEHAQTYKASWQGYNVVVKKCDIWNQGSVVEELKHEARVYQVLRTLQGRYIPELRIAGVADGMEMMLVTDFVGTDVSQERLDDSDQEKIRAALSAIHDLGVVHGDVRPQNILVQHDGPNARFYFVDFGMSWITADKTELNWEKDVLDSLLRDMAADRS
ncbi:hypothetical protein CPB97_005365 [Podila verticillata]|nr:hypothetical protein CPB97_005365 [Podila verticillata]